MFIRAICKMHISIYNIQLKSRRRTIMGFVYQVRWYRHYCLISRFLFQYLNSFVSIGKHHHGLVLQICLWIFHSFSENFDIAVFVMNIEVGNVEVKSKNPNYNLVKLGKIGAIMSNSCPFGIGCRFWWVFIYCRLQQLFEQLLLYQNSYNLKHINRIIQQPCHSNTKLTS